MSHRIRGYRPPVLPTGPKAEQSPSDKARVLLRPGGAVLGPGQHLVLPGRTGLAHLQDHFDARRRPDYEARLKGEAPPPDSSKTADAQQQLAQSASAFDPARHAAEALLRTMPRVDDEEREEDSDEHERGNTSGEPEEVAFAARTVELQGGVFTLGEGSLDAEQHALATLEAFLDGDVPFISVAVDLAVIPYGTPLAIPALDASWGRALVFRAVHQTARTAGATFGYLEICASAGDDANTLRALDRVLAVTFG